MAIASRDIAMRSPAVSSRSSSRGLGAGVMPWAIASSSSVVSPIAETTTTTSLPARRDSSTRSATARMRLLSATDVPPYFWTTVGMARAYPRGGSGAGRRAELAPAGDLAGTGAGARVEQAAVQHRARDRDARSDHLAHPLEPSHHQQPEDDDRHRDQFVRLASPGGDHRHARHPDGGGETRVPHEDPDHDQHA